MGHDYYKNADTYEAEHARLVAMLGEALDDQYCPWEGPGFDVETAAGVWGFLRVKLDGGEVVIVGLHGEYRLPLTEAKPD